MYQYTRGHRGHQPYFPSDYWEYYIDQGPDGYRILDAPYLDSILEKEEENYKHSDEQSWSKTRRRMSDQSSQLHSNDSSGFGGSISPGSSSMQTSDSQNIMYGSVPDISSSGLHGTEEVNQSLHSCDQSQPQDNSSGEATNKEEVIISGKLEKTGQLPDDSFSELEPLMASTPTKVEQFDFEESKELTEDEDVSQDGRTVLITKMMQESKTFQPIESPEKSSQYVNQDECGSDNDNESMADNSHYSVRSVDDLKDEDHQETIQGSSPRTDGSDGSITIQSDKSTTIGNEVLKTEQSEKSVTGQSERSIMEQTSEKSVTDQCKKSVTDTSEKSVTEQNIKSTTGTKGSITEQRKDEESVQPVISGPRRDDSLFTDDYMNMQLGRASRASSDESNTSDILRKTVSFGYVESIMSAGRVVSEVLRNEDINVEDVEHGRKSQQTEEAGSSVTDQTFGNVSSEEDLNQTRDDRKTSAGLSDTRKVEESLHIETKQDADISHETQISKEVQLKGDKETSSNRKVEESHKPIVKASKSVEEDIPSEVPEDLKSYIDPQCPEWKDPNTRKLIYKFALRQYQRETGVTFGQSGIMETKSKTRNLLGPKDSMKGIVPAQILKHKQKQKLSEALSSGTSLPLSRKSSKPETGVLRPAVKSEGLKVHSSKEFQKPMSPEEFPIKIYSENLKIQKEIAHHSDNTPGYGAFSFTSPSKLLTKIENDGKEDDKSNTTQGDNSAAAAAAAAAAATAAVSSEIAGRDATPSHMQNDQQENKGLRQQEEKVGQIYVRNERMEETISQKSFRTEKELDACQYKHIGANDSGELSTPIYTRCDDISDIIYTPPSQLLVKIEQREHLEANDKSPGLGAYSFTTPSTLIAVEQTTTATNADHHTKRSAEHIAKYGYGDADFTSPSDLLEHLQVLDTESDTSANKDHVSQNLPAEDGQKDKEEVNNLTIENAGNVQRSSLPADTGHINVGEKCLKNENIENVQKTSLVLKKCFSENCDCKSTSSAKKCDSELDRSTPSKLLRKVKDREKTEDAAKSPGYAIFSFTSPSQLVANPRLSKELDSSDIKRSTPSGILQKEVTDAAERSPGSAVLSYTSPSKRISISGGESLEIDQVQSTVSPKTQQKRDSDETITTEHLMKQMKMFHHENTTASQLLAKREDREKTEEAGKSPGYGEFSFTSPSQLITNEGQMLQQKDELLEYTTPSQLLKKREDREKTEAIAKSPGYGEFSFTSPSQLIGKEIQPNDQRLETLEYTTPSQLLKKREDREKTEGIAKSPGYGEFSFTSPSQLNGKEIQPKGQRHETLEYTTPSQLLKKREDREKTEAVAKSPGYGEFSFTSPSQLIGKEIQPKGQRRETRKYTTPSQLLKKREDRERTEATAKSPGYGEFSFTSPSQLLTKERQSAEHKEKSADKIDRAQSFGKSSFQSDTLSVTGSDYYNNNDHTKQSKAKIPDSRVTSDLTTYFLNISDILDKTVKRINETISEPFFERFEQSIEDNSSEHKSEMAITKISDRVTDQQEASHSGTQCTVLSDDEHEELVHTIMSNGKAMIKPFPVASSTKDHDFDLGSNISLADWKNVLQSEGEEGIGKSVESVGSVPGMWFFNFKSSDAANEDSDVKADESNYRTNILNRDKYVSTSSGYPLSEMSSERLESSLILTSNPDFHCYSSDEESEFSVDTEKQNPTASAKKADDTSTKVPKDKSGPAADITDESQQDKALPGSLSSINELFWSLYTQNPKIINESVQALISDTNAFTTLNDMLSQINTASQHTALSTSSTNANKASSQGKQSDGNHNSSSVYSPRPTKAHLEPSTPTNTSSMSKVNNVPTTKALLVLQGQQNQKKRHLPHTGGRSMTPEARSWIMEKDVLESQNRKLQNEISSLQSANSSLKEKYSRSTAKIANLEELLSETKEELETVQTKMRQEISAMQYRNQSELSGDVAQLTTRVASLTKENEDLKSEVASLEKQLDSAEKATDMSKFSLEKSKAIEAFKMENATLKDEVNKVKSLLQQSEQHLHEEESRNREQGQQILKLTEMKNLLQQQVEMAGGTTVADKQLKSLDKRLRITEERLHQERADRANNLSEVEDKLLTENARLQAVEKELNRQLQREKDKNRNLDNKIRDVREENEKLRLALPFDESSLTTQKAYDIPYSVHTSQRLDSVKTPDFKYVMSQVEQQSGMSQEKEVICHLYSTRETTYHQLRQLEFILQDLNLRDNNITEGLKNLRDVKGQYEAKLRQAEEQLEDAKAEKSTYESTYKEQLSVLVKERHDAFARLKTSEDLLEATRAENEILKKNAVLGVAGINTQTSSGQGGQLDALTIKVKDLENQIQQLTRANKLLEGEVSSLNIQLSAKNKALEDAHSEVDKANIRLDNSEALDRKQQKIDKLMSEVNSLKSEIQLMAEKNNSLNSDRKRLEYELESTQRDLNHSKMKQKESKAGEAADHKIVESLKDEVDEKNRKISQLLHELQNSESQLQQNRHELLNEQSKIGNVEAEIESLQRQIEQRGSILDTISAGENEHTAQFKILKDTLDSVSQELNQKRAESEVLQAELSREKDRTEMLEKEMADLKDIQDDSILPREATGEQLQIKELQYEREQLKEKLIQATTTLEKMTYDMAAVQKEMKQHQEELAEEKSKLLQVSTEKGELEQHLEEIAEEHDAIIQEKAQIEDDLVKLENKLQEILQAVEMEARKQHDNFETLYTDLPPQARKIAVELDSMRTLLGAKNKEVLMMQDKLGRQNMEMEFLQRRIDLLHNENQCNRDDIARLSTTLATKIKDTVSVREMNQFLSAERSKLQKDKENSEKELHLERNLKDRCKTDMSSVIHKLENDMITSSRKGQDELSTTSHKLEMLNQEHQMLVNNLSAEKQAVEELKADLRLQQSECERLRQEVHTLSMDLESSQKQLLTSKETIDNLNQDKDAIYKEYDSMFRKLGEKDEKIRELQEKCDRTVEDMRKEFTLQQHCLQEEKTSTERDLDKSKDEINILNEDIKQKDVQLMTFGKTLQELEEVKRQKQELELEVEKLESTSGDVKLLLESHRKEINLQQDSISRLKDMQAELQLEKSRIEKELKEEKDMSSAKILQLNQTVTDLRNHNEGEKLYLKDNLSQTQTRLQSLESSLASAVEARDKLQVSNRLTERSLEETKGQLQDETTSRKVSEQRAETLQSQLNESRKDRFLTEEKLNQTQATLTKTEKDLRTEKDKCNRLLEQIQELEAKTYSLESTSKAKQEQVDVLQTEVNKLKQIVDNQKQQIGGRLKKSTQEFKQQIDIIESERSSMSQQIQKLQEDLNMARDTTLNKNKEILKLQENILSLEDQVRVRTAKLRHVEDTLRAEEELQSQLSSKYQAQEEELKRLKNFLSKKAEEAGETDKSMWQDMNRVIQEMSRQIQIHFDSQKNIEKSSKSPDAKILKRYKKQITDLETDLNTEKALHQITKTSLQALEEDCQRLRQQFHAIRRRETSSSEKKSKNRMEAINEIIARSQTHAQAMLAAGGYFDETLRSLTTPRGGDNLHGSPDTSIASDFSFNSVGPAIIPIYPTTPSPTKTPRKY